MVTVTKFETPTCVPCKTVDVILTDLKEDMGFNLVRVNTYTEAGADLANQYHLKSVPAVLIENDRGYFDMIPYLAEKAEYQEKIKQAFAS